MKIPESNLEHQTRHRIKAQYLHSLRLKFTAMIAGAVLLISGGIAFFVITQFSQISGKSPGNLGTGLRSHVVNHRKSERSAFWASALGCSAEPPGSLHG
ncbi:MAG: hypothetical protein JXR86_02610 [Spirochaetales bacterium]|nr:hypothetical protein [Spirochaetales bacterium]